MDSRSSDRPLPQNSPDRSFDPNAETLPGGVAPPDLPRSSSPASRKFRWVSLGALVAVLAVGGVIWFARHSKPHAAPAGAKIRIAVLPFKNLTGDPHQEFVSDGFAEEVIGQLGRLNHDQLGVIAGTSVMGYKNTRKPLKKIARELDVNYVLEGTVQSGGDGFRIGTRLVHADDEMQVWAEEYDRPNGDLKALGEEVAQTVAEELQVKRTPGTPGETPVPRSVNRDAYLYYLQGRFFFNMRTGENLINAVNSFDQAVRQDPGFAQAYAGLADSYNMMMYYGYSSEKEAVPKARNAATTAIELDGSLAPGHASLGYIYFFWEWDWQKAELEFKDAIALDNSYAPAHHWYALYLSAMGRRAEALSQIEMAHELDPLSPIVTTATAYIAYNSEQYDRAAEQCERVLQQDPKFMVAHAVLGLAREAQGGYATAISEFQQALQLSGSRPPEYVDNLGHAYGVSGQRAKAEAILKELERAVKSGKVGEESAAATLIGLGQQDQAVAAMEKNFAKGDPALVWLKVDPRFDQLRPSPRFQALLQRAGLSP
jgi:TolB-like protein/Tfp pilus assembly protein PilF